MVDQRPEARGHQGVSLVAYLVTPSSDELLDRGADFFGPSVGVYP